MVENQKKKTTNKIYYKEWVNPTKLMMLTAWARDGLTYEEIAEKIGINRATLTEWKSTYPQVDIALSEGKQEVDTKVENALLQRALGTTIDEITEEYDENGKIIKTKKITKKIAPEITAQIYWLKNRQYEKWKDRIDQHTQLDQKIEISLADNISDLSK